MARYTITRTACDDITDIWKYIRRGSEQNADRVIDDLWDHFERIAETPGLGHQREDIDDDRFRFTTRHSLVVVYRIDLTPIRIMRVVHGSRDFGQIDLEAP